VTQAEIDNGGVLDPTLSISNTPPRRPTRVRRRAPPQSVPIAQNPGLALTKAGTFNDTNGDGFAEPHETVSYSFFGNEHRQHGPSMVWR